MNTINCDSKKNTVTLAELMYYLFFAVMLTAKGLGLYDGQWLYTLAILAGALFIVCKLILSGHSLYEWIAIVCLFVLAALIYAHSSEFGIFIVIATIVGMKDVSVKRVMNLGCIIWIVTFSFSCLITLSGIRTDIFRAQEKLGLGHVIRWSLGQPHPNVLQISFILLCAFLFYTCSFKGKAKYIATALMFIGNMYIFMYSISYTGIVLAVFYLFINLYLSKENKTISKAETLLAMLVVPLCAAFSILGPLLLKGRIWDICNKLLNTRFDIAKQYMTLNPVSLFGSGYCDELTPFFNNLDCSYVFALMHYGIIFFGLFFAGYIVLIYVLAKENRRIELGIVIALLVAAISEPFFVNSSFKNITLIFLGELFYIGMQKLFDRKDIKAIGACSLGKKEISLPLDKVEDVWEKYKSTFDKCKKHIIVIGILIGLAAAIATAVLRPMPSAYYMIRDHVQIISKGETFDINDLPDDFDGQILEYVDDKTPMIRLDGNAVALEKVRGVASVFVWCSLGAVAGISAGVYISQNKKKKNV